MKHTFFKKTLLLISGTSLGQMIIFISSPLLTKFYSADDFGIFNIYVSILSILLIICTLRYDMAIPIAKDEKDALHLVFVSMFVLFIFSLFISLILVLISFISLHTHTIQFQKIYFFIPISVFFIGTYQIFSNWNIRNAQFTLITRTKLSQSIVLTISTICMGMCNLKYAGLILGDTFGKSFGSIVMIKHFIQKKIPDLKSTITKQYAIHIMKVFKRYPLVTTWSSLLNAMGLLLPPALFTLFFNNATGGYFAFGHRIVGTPILLIGQAVSQVYTSEFTKGKNLIAIFKKIIFILSLLSLLGALILFFGAETLFSLIFGEHWRTSGTYVSILSFMYFFYMITFPVSQTLHLLGKQFPQLIWDCSRVIFIFLLFLSVHLFSLPIMDTIKIYSIGMGIFYFIQLVIIYFALKQKEMSDYA